MLFSLQLTLALISLPFSDISFSIEPSSVEFTPFRGEEVVHIPGGVSPFAEGEPSLPGIGYSMVIPQETYLDKVQVEVLASVDFPGIHNIAPVISIPLDEMIPILIPHFPNYYSEQFPSAEVQQVNTGNKTGFRIASFTYVPFTWEPSTGTLSLVTSARLTPIIREAADAPSLRLSNLQVRTALSALESIVINPEMLNEYSPEIVPDVDGSPWVVIADEESQTTLQPLIDLRTSTHGASFVSTQWIYANYTGRDTQEQIRNFIKDAYENQGLVYALIVGDGAPYGSGETTRISGLVIGGNLLGSTTDLYYADLDGSWDADNDDNFGELSDNVDYYTDVYIGRYSSEVAARLEIMVNRTVAYETTAPAGTWQNTALLVGADMWPPYSGTFICDSIDVRIPNSWTVHKLYETPESHPTNQIDLLNEGVSYASVNGHGNEAGIYWYYTDPKYIISAANYTDLTNESIPTVFHSIACKAGSIQNIASIAERLMFNSSGGAVAVMFNSQNGVGSPPAMGASEWLELLFAEALFVSQQYEIGVAHGVSKDEFKANVSVSYKHWVLQENNLLGDPALRFVAGQTGIEEGEGNPSSIAPAIFTPSPNPARNICTVNYTMPASGTASVSLFDLSGRMVATIHRGFLSEGQGSIEFDTSYLPSGCYSIVIYSETGSATKQMLVLR